MNHRMHQVKRHTMMQNRRILLLLSSLLLIMQQQHVESFSFQLPNFFGGASKLTRYKPTNTAQTIQTLLDCISGTNSGKSASPAQQIQVLEIVRRLEQTQNNIELKKVLKQLDGVWYLQYTSPSNVGEFEYTPVNASEGDANIETQRFEAKGTVSAAGIKVDTSNKVVQQILDTANSRITNRVELDWGIVQVSGQFRISDSMPNRAVVGFDTADITLNNGFVLNIGFVFAILAFFRGSPDSGWLETTYLDDTVRIGRGNKSTMFVLTRDRNAVVP